MLLAGLASYPVVAGDRQVLVVLALGGVACVVVAAGLVLRQWLVLAWGFAVFGAEYATFLRLRENTVDVRAPLVAAGLLVAAELGFAAIAPERGRAERALVAAELAALAGAAFATVVVAGVLLLVAGSATAGVALEAVGALAAVAAVGAIASVVRRAPSRRS